MFSNKRQDLRRLLDDVTHRQIDTIVADAIQGTSLDDPLKGLEEIAVVYAAHLESLGLELGEAAKKGDKAGYEILRDRAQQAYQQGRAHSAADRALAGRIWRRSTKLAIVAGNIAAAQDGSIEPRDRAAISAAWELGTAPIAMQSVISLDGDLVTRVSRAFSDAEHAAIHQIHSEAVTVSLNTWEMLVQGIGSLARSFVK